MKRIGIAAGCLNQTPMDWPGNRARIIGAIDSARERGVRLLCLPELCVTGYGCDDAFLSPALWSKALESLALIVPHTQGMMVVVGAPVAHDNMLYNCACVLGDGVVRGFAAKQNLAGRGLHYEPRWFRPWIAGRVAHVRCAGVDVPMGDLVFSASGVRFGFEICEDAWVEDRPGVRLKKRAIDVIFNPSASHFSFGKSIEREKIIADGSREFDAAYVFANMLGNEAGRIIYDGQTVIASGGEIVARGRRLSFEDLEIASAAIEVGGAAGRTALQQDDAIDVGVDPYVDRIEETGAEREPWETSGDVKEEEFARAVALGLYDSMRKSRAKGFVVSLSGGADSAAVACLVAKMVELACAQIGVEQFRKATGAEGDSVRDLVRSILTTAYQSTRNSSDETRRAARNVADDLGARHLELDVDALAQGYVEMIEGAIGRDLTWEDDDLALQNIQARSRAPGVWMLANIEGKLLLATSNRSEAAVGYTTMDGDTAGGVSPIAGIDKAFLRTWLRWLEKTGPMGGTPSPGLALVNSLEPTAELRPAGSGQTDEGDLMPYPVLEAIEESAIGRKRSPIEVFEDIRTLFTDPNDDELAAWIDRFFRLWSRNQWKRERYAPAYHVDDRNLDPRTWCRFPILSGGFEEELGELREYVRARSSGAG